MRNLGKGVGVLAVGVGAAVYFFRNQITERLPATGSIVNFGADWTRHDVRLALRAQASGFNFNPDWFDAISRHEANWKLDARSPASAADEKYGGAWGPMQMLKTNIERLGYTVEGVTGNPNTAGECAAALMSECNPETFEDAIAWWNAGKKHFADLSASHDTRTKYYPAVLADLAWVQENQP